MESLFSRIAAVEQRLAQIEMAKAITKVKSDLGMRGVMNNEFCIVPDDYYEKTVEERAKLLQASTLDQLCKTIVFENMSFKDTKSSHAYNDITNTRYLCVIVQYSAKINTDMLVQALIHLRKPGDGRLTKSNYNFQIAPEHISNELTGFTHNGVCPYALKTSLPIVVCQRCIDVTPPLIWMGGGHPRVKLRVSAADFLRSTGALSLLVSQPRPTMSF